MGEQTTVLMPIQGESDRAVPIYAEPLDGEIYSAIGAVDHASQNESWQFQGRFRCKIGSIGGMSGLVAFEDADDA